MKEIQTHVVSENILISIKNGIVYMSEYDPTKGWITYEAFNLHSEIERLEIKKNREIGKSEI